MEREISVWNKLWQCLQSITPYSMQKLPSFASKLIISFLVRCVVVVYLFKPGMALHLPFAQCLQQTTQWPQASSLFKWTNLCYLVLSNLKLYSSVPGFRNFSIILYPMGFRMSSLGSCIGDVASDDSLGYVFMPWLTNYFNPGKKPAMCSLSKQPLFANLHKNWVKLIFWQACVTIFIEL